MSSAANTVSSMMLSFFSMYIGYLHANVKIYIHLVISNFQIAPMLS